MPELEVMTEHLQLTQALYAIAQESEEAETVKLAMSALTNTEAGRAYLAANPFVV